MVSSKIYRIFFLYFPGHAHFDDDLSIDELNIQRESAHSETNSRENGGGIQNLWQSSKWWRALGIIVQGNFKFEYICWHA